MLKKFSKTNVQAQKMGQKRKKKERSIFDRNERVRDEKKGKKKKEREKRERKSAVNQKGNRNKVA